MTKTMEVAPLSACEHSKNSMFCIGPCEACKAQLARKNEQKNSVDKNSAANIKNHSKLERQCRIVPQITYSPDHRVHWSDEDESGNTSQELETIIKPVENLDLNPASQNTEEANVKSILKHKPTCVVMVHVDTDG